MDHNDQRDYAEESANRAEMEREGREELEYERERERYCICPQPTWVSGMMYVDILDVESVYEMNRENGRGGPVDQGCDKPYHPRFSFDPYAF